jgi:hypothetical protein
MFDKQHSSISTPKYTVYGIKLSFHKNENQYKKYKIKSIKMKLIGGEL